MTTYAELKAQTEIALEQEIAEFVQRIKAQMKECGVTLADLVKK